jgi:hypothetical protein
MNTEEKRKEQIRLEDVYRPSDETRDFIFDVYDKLIKWRALRDQPYKQFNNQTCTDYWTDARQKFFGFLPISFDNDTPQFFFPETRNQIISILAKVAALRTKPSFEGVEGFDIVKGTLLRSLFEYWKRNSNRDINNFWQYLYNIINGTVIVFTAYSSRVREVKNITMHDPETGETDYETVKLDDSDVEETICNLEDIYVPKLWEHDIQKQDEIIWRTLLRWGDFKEAFQGYALKDVVMPGSQFSDTSIFTDFLSYDVRGQDFVEVIKYFNKAKDQYAIIANGVLLNPIKRKNMEEIAPLPWNHKELPFSKTIWEPIDTTMQFYGMPLAQKVKSAQEALNRMWELLLDREERAVASPIITNDPSAEFGLEFKAGRIYQIQAPVDQYREITMAPTSASYWNALTTLQGVIGKTGSGGMGPVSPSRQPRSATENASDSLAKKEAQGLSYMFYEDLMEQKAWLAIMNMIQFYTSSKVEKIIGEREFNKILVLSEQRLASGGMGNMEIRITKNPAPAEELKKESWMRSLLKKEKVEIIEVSPEAMRGLKFDITIDFESENSPETERALYLDYIMTISKLFGQSGLLSQKKMLYRTIEKFNESISDVVDDNVAQEYEKERFGVNPPQTAQPGGMPAVNGVNQQMRGMMSGAAGGSQNIMGNSAAAMGPQGFGQ